MSNNSVNKNQEMKIEQRDVDALTPYAFNAKKPSGSRPSVLPEIIEGGD